VLSALSTGHKTAILVFAAVFIVFALTSSFVFPKLNPNFPGRRIALFVGVCMLLTAAMLGAVIAFAGEPKEKRETASEAAPSAPVKPSAPSAPAAPAGDATAGKSLFSAEGCSACHTFTPAGSKASVGPDLDKVAADARKANRGPLAGYVAESIKDPAAYVVPGYPNGVMPTNFSSLSAKQIADLVAFITSGKS